MIPVDQLPRWMAFALLMAAIFLPPGEARAQNPVSLELILAIDASGSVDDNEFELQMMGLAQAFRDDDVISAIERAGPQGVAIAMVQWACWNMQELSVEWTLVRDRASALNLSDRLERTPRLVLGQCTAIGNALDRSMRLLGLNRYDGVRRVIDVSGDGPTNHGLETSAMRDKAVSLGITVNGLAILNGNEPDLDKYYRDEVIGGSGAFLLTATDFTDFARAIRRKLIKEIEGVPLAYDFDPALNVGLP